MLAGQQGGRDDDGNLLAVHGGDEGGAQRHFGLAETDVAADQAIHRTPRSQIFQHGGDRILAGRRSRRRESAAANSS